MTDASPCSAEPRPTTEEIAAARVWALDNDHQALLAHRFALLTQAAWEAQAAADRHLVARHRAALS